VQHAWNFLHFAKEIKSKQKGAVNWTGLGKIQDDKIHGLCLNMEKHYPMLTFYHVISSQNCKLTNYTYGPHDTSIYLVHRGEQLMLDILNIHQCTLVGTLCHDTIFSLFPGGPIPSMICACQESWYKCTCSCIHQNKYLVWEDEYNYQDCLQVHLIESISHYESGKRCNYTLCAVQIVCY